MPVTFGLAARINVVAGGVTRGFRLERFSVGSKSCVMKMILALCFAALCLTTHGQTTKTFFTKGAWHDYMAINKKIAQLEAKAKALSLDTVEKKGLTRLQGQAKKISNDEANQAELAADKDLMSKTEQLQKDSARLRLKLQELDMRYAMPSPLPATPKPAKKSKS